jgi:hypothetical protein
MAIKGNKQKRFVTVLEKTGEPRKLKLNPIEKQHNEETMKLAQQIMQKKDNQLNKPEIYTDYERQQMKIKERENTSFLEYFNHFCS